MTSPPPTPRMIRQARDRAVSVALAILVGVIIGVGGFLWWQHQKSITAPLPHTPRAATVANQLAPHKALYKVELTGTRSGAQIIDIQGQMFFKLHLGCEGYVTDHRFALTYHYADSDPMRITSDFSTVESLDGTRFDFTSRRRRDSELYQELRGQAQIKPQEPGTATYSEPEDKVFDLPAGTLFPALHTRVLLSAARSGKKFLTQTIFDGSDEDGPVDVTAIITKPQAPKNPAWPAAVDPTLVAGSAHRVRMAFFPKKSPVETPDYELVMDVLDNGVITGMIIDYSDFSVKQTLLALEPIEPEKCGAAAK